jgi:hypothetical protein
MAGSAAAVKGFGPMLPMGVNWIGASIDFFTLVLGGVYVTLLGYRIIGKKRGLDLDYDLRMNKARGTPRFCGPLLIVIGIVMVLFNLAK